MSDGSGVVATTHRRRRHLRPGRPQLEVHKERDVRDDCQPAAQRQRAYHQPPAAQTLRHILLSISEVRRPATFYFINPIGIDQWGYCKKRVLVSSGLIQWGYVMLRYLVAGYRVTICSNFKTIFNSCLHFVVL